MKYYPFNEREKKMATTCHSGLMCEKCEGKSFVVSKQGHPDDGEALWFVCTKCSHTEDMDISRY